MAKKKKLTQQITGSPVALEALLRSGSGKHGDRRLKRQKTRAGQMRAALREAS